VTAGGAPGRVTSRVTPASDDEHYSASRLTMAGEARASGQAYLGADPGPWGGPGLDLIGLIFQATKPAPVRENNGRLPLEPFVCERLIPQLHRSNNNQYPRSIK
jgi:hypothetical protein